ncbi:helix-turn-helix domain-containing protein [Paraburkholderia sp. RL17-380-BIE-A]|uniref:helix-turn-helix domain-containing protein n=1 Tax=Paraburkholderia sp. RL17-380-BIE-A TaxID=3031630 RepID=UPI0038B95EE0
MNQTMTVAEVAVMLNVTPAYVVKLIGNGKLRARRNPDGRYTVARKEAEAYRLRGRRRGRRALENLARVSESADIYNKQT